jgi:murein DD-endopeptidase MepM/ murein hydrolase activator NlpD
MADGKVAASSPHYPYQTSGYTSNLSVDHGNGLMATYLHMTPAKKVGSTVKRGERIGKLIPLGTASNSYAQTHLHLQTYKDGKVINPLRVFDGTVKPGSGTNVGEVKSPPEEGKPVITSSAAQVKPPEKTSPPISPPPQNSGKTAVLPVPGSNQQRPQTSGVSAGQKDVPSFSSRDLGNTEFIVIKSIYNIVG